MKRGMCFFAGFAMAAVLLVSLEGRSSGEDTIVAELAREPFYPSLLDWILVTTNAALPSTHSLAVADADGGFVVYRTFKISELKGPAADRLAIRESCHRARLVLSAAITTAGRLHSDFSDEWLAVAADELNHKEHFRLEARLIGRSDPFAVCTAGGIAFTPAYHSFMAARARRSRR